MLKAIFVGNGLVANRIFDRSDPSNRDDCFEPYIELREAFRRQNIQLDTADVGVGQPVAFELHLNMNDKTGNCPAYLMLLETPIVYPNNGKTSKFINYRRIFTWNDDLVDHDRFMKLNLPNPIVVPNVSGFAGRDRFCCMIAGNKAATQSDPRELYSERVRVIRWFEKNAPGDFDLYGVDWDLPPPHPGIFGKIFKRLWRYGSNWIHLVPFPSYRGKVEHKRDVLQRTRFSICYENVRDLPGYITEKIFDCFFSGCVPVYWGANNITDHIPAECFIDRRNFVDTNAVYQHLKAMDEPTYSKYQKHIADFLRSDAAYKFSSNFFAETIVNAVVSDLGP